MRTNVNNNKALRRHRRIRRHYKDKHAKLQYLNGLHYNPQAPSYNEKAILNLSSIKLPHNVKFILSLGPKFNLPHHFNEFPIDEFIKTSNKVIENLSTVADISELNYELRHYLNELIISQNITDKNDEQILQYYKECEDFLNKNGNLIVTNSDKGQVTVILEKELYFDKLNSLLNEGINDGTYVQFENERCFWDNFMKSKKDIIDLIKSEDCITNSTCKDLLGAIESESILLPKLYIVLKIHKVNIPGRPIVSAINSPSANIQRYLLPLLKILTNKLLNVKNSDALKDHLSRLTIPHTHTFISLDIVNMFTNIPIDLALHVISAKFHIIARFTDIPLNLFMKLTIYSLESSNIFTSRGKLFRMKYGLPMGGILSSIISCIMLDHFIEIKLQCHVISKEILLFKKYVDDILCLIHKEAINEFLIELNGIHQRIKFTLNLPTNNALNYLDMTILNDNGKLTTCWYQKDMCSKRLLNFHSNNPLSTKRNVAKQFIFNALNLTDANHKGLIKKQVSNNLVLNNYPKALINSTIYNFQRQHERNDL